MEQVAVEIARKFGMTVDMAGESFCRLANLHGFSVSIYKYTDTNYRLVCRYMSDSRESKVSSIEKAITIIAKALD